MWSMERRLGKNGKGAGVAGAQGRGDEGGEVGRALWAGSPPFRWGTVGSEVKQLTHVSW